MNYAHKTLELVEMVQRYKSRWGTYEYIMFFNWWLRITLEYEEPETLMCLAGQLNKESAPISGHRFQTST